MTTGQMKRLAVHDTLTIERTFPVAPAKVFAAFADPTVKAKWFVVPDEWELHHKMDFRVGGEETQSCGPRGGELFHTRARFEDIVPDERIVYSYDMQTGGRRFSVSLVTFEFAAQGSGTLLKLTEQSVYLDEFEDAIEMRKYGYEELLNTVDKFLSK